MLWSKLFDKISSQPMADTKRQKVRAVINGKTVELDLKFDETGPYLVPKATTTAKQSTYKVLQYIIAKEQTCKSVDEVRSLLKNHGGNILYREVKQDGQIIRHWYNHISKSWHMPDGSIVTTGPEDNRA